MDSAQLDTIRQSLRKQLNAIVNVQACYTPPHTSQIIVHTWTGVVIHIQIVTAPMKTRSIRHMVQEATDSGIGSLFILDRQLLPAPDIRLTVPEWLMAIHVLAHERIYCVSVGDRGVVIEQLHFEPISATGDMAARYGPAVKLERLRYLRTIVKPRYIRGEWQIADFGVDAFWKDPYEARHTSAGAHYYRPDPREYQWKSWSSTGWDQPSTQDIPRPVMPARDRITTAYELLNLERGATKEEVSAAYRRLALDYHPDTSTLPSAEAEAKFRALSEAYEAIQRANRWK